MPTELIGSTRTCWEQTAIDLAWAQLKNIDHTLFLDLNNNPRQRTFAPTHITITSLGKRVRFRATPTGFSEPEILETELIHPAEQLFHVPTH